MSAYYNEIDPFAASWLRELIKAGVIAQGEVDERSIEDITPNELRKYTQCHFFAGIGVWSYALRQAGWPDDRQVWTGSCPCQPFSAAGKRKGAADERHLWPAFFHLINECRPLTIFGEQVASKDGLTWLDLVSSDLEGADYAIGAVDICAASFGAPHIRQRLYFVSDSQYAERWPEQKEHIDSYGRDGLGRSSNIDELEHAESDGRLSRRPESSGWSTASRCSQDALDNAADTRHDNAREHISGSSLFSARSEQPSNAGEWMANPKGAKLDRIVIINGESRKTTEQKREESRGGSAISGVEHAASEQVGVSGRPRKPRIASSRVGQPDGTGSQSGSSAAEANRHGSPSFTAGFWSECSWLPCIDGKARPVESGPQQMVDGSTKSLGLVRDVNSVEKEIEAWGKRHQTDPRKALRNLWNSLQSEAIQQWSYGRCYSVREAPFLLAFLRQLTNQGWRFAFGNECASSEAAKIMLRIVRVEDVSGDTPYKRGLDEQQRGESTNAVQELSQIVAYYTEEEWGDSGWQKTAQPFPLTTGVVNRVGRLRGYGNSLVAPVAQGFIEAYLETISSQADSKPE